MLERLSGRSGHRHSSRTQISARHHHLPHHSPPTRRPLKTRHPPLHSFTCLHRSHPVIHQTTVPRLSERQSRPKSTSGNSLGKDGVFGGAVGANGKRSKRDHGRGGVWSLAVDFIGITWTRGNEEWVAAVFGNYAVACNRRRVVCAAGWGPDQVSSTSNLTAKKYREQEYWREGWGEDCFYSSGTTWKGHNTGWRRSNKNGDQGSNAGQTSIIHQRA